MIKKCMRCYAEFKVKKSSKQKFCSKKCYWEYKKEQTRNKPLLCRVCLKEKETNEFGINKLRSTGIGNICKECARAYAKKRYWSNPEKHRLTAKESQRIRKEKGLCLNCGLTTGGYRNGLCRRCFDMKLKTSKDRHTRNRKTVLSHYGGKCVCCGETEPLFLTIDHINNDGAKHRKKTKGIQFYPWIIRNGFPEDLQILCWNCNMGKYHNGGICPHVEKGKKNEL